MFKVKDKKFCRKIDYNLTKEVPDWFYGKEFESIDEDTENYVILIGGTYSFPIPKKFCD